MHFSRVAFFFDFSDISGYLASLQLASLRQRYGVDIEARPVDRNVLLAAVTEPALKRGEAGSAYLRCDQERWAKKLGVKLRWPQKPVASAQALRLFQHVADHFPERAFELCAWLFEAIWGRATPLTEALLDKALENVGLGGQVSARSIDRNESFLSLDASQELAMSRGVFELPAILVGQSVFYGYDRFDFVERELLRSLLEELPHERLAEHFAEWLWTRPEEERRAVVEALDQGELSHRKSELSVRSGFDAFLASIRTLPNLESEARLPVTSPSAPLRLAVLPTRIEAEWSAALLPCFGAMSERRLGLVFGPTPLRLFSLEDAKRILEEHYPDGPFEGLLGPVRIGHERHILHAPPAAAAGASLLRLLPDEALGYGPGTEDALQPLLLSNGLAVYLNETSARASLLQRRAARQGAHLLVLGSSESPPLLARAAAIRTQRWVLSLGELPYLFEPRGQARPLEPQTMSEQILEWPPRLEDAEGWRAEPPRTLLVDDDVIHFGGAESGADVCLSVRGNGLLVSTSESKSLLSANRRVESVRSSAGVLLLLPFLGEQIMCAETVLLKLLSALARSAKEARLVLVNYWPELSFSTLELSRPVLAATASEHRLPVLVVTSSRVLELWQADASGTAYRVESNAERFPVELSRLPSVAARQDELVQRLGPRFEQMVSTLQTYPRSV
ncbi:MAG: DsbA family protein [Myxococcota bacterium]|jgi:2-hydroxychromene-2-carboxylate isomerase|nr:DsbA family protein [Myxococcota bacterium]